MSEFPAKYKGTCAAGDEILPGQEVMYVDDELYHVECISDPKGPDKWTGTTLEDMGY